MSADDAHRVDSTDPASNEALVEKYGAVGYESKANALAHPNRLAAIATLHGLSPPPVATCRVLELGCSDGANLFPMAALLPEARFVGCDLSPHAIAAGRGALAELGLQNVTLVEGDLRELPAALGSFDYIIAHGVYSWVPADVRDALFALAARLLSEHGLMYVSYNVYPGCHVRQAAWEVLRSHSDRVSGARERLDAARALASALADPGVVQNETDVLLRREFARIAKLSDSALYHDDLAVPNDPVYFHDFVAHAQRYGIGYVSDAKLFNSSELGVSPSMQRLIAGLGPIEREQYRDFACMRRFRQSILCRSELASALAVRPERTAGMHISASMSLANAVAQGKASVNPLRPALDPAEAQRLRSMLERLVAVAPRALPAAELEAWVTERHSKEAATTGPFSSLLVSAAFADEILLHAHPPQLTELASERPFTSPVIRWQAARGESLTNLCHEQVRITDAPPRALLALLDGERDRTALDSAVGPALGVDEPSARRRRIDNYVRTFGRLGLLIH